MKPYSKLSIAALFLVGAVGCTSLSEGQVSTTAPNMNRRVPSRGAAGIGLREGMDGKASEINRKRNIEQFDKNLPAMTPPAVRPHKLPHAPVDTVNHKVQQPLNTKVPPID
ncbi:hypothetical protein I2I11_03630 [Pontibacter sp. 172403-2]|uniref:hypothetical protein n=1 Tax=Pontibacter rufus TaxID=2791028 RepID=UPI0018B00AD8|nr:hypothetical protein [Pontibacter sp. 172403-2]MBF9252375.1 hypothetical protein [Pontibacter sp. 172403-2]